MTQIVDLNHLLLTKGIWPRISSALLPLFLAAIPDDLRQSRRFGFALRSLPGCLALIYQCGVPERVQVLPAVEAHLDAIPAAILSESGMQRLMDVPDNALLSFWMHRIIFIDREEL